MSGSVPFENGDEPGTDFLDLINRAAQGSGDGEKSIQTGRGYLGCKMTPLYNEVVEYFMKTLYPKVDSKILDPKVHSLCVRGAFLHQPGKLPNPPHQQYMLIVIPLLLNGEIRTGDNIALEVGRPIYIRANTSLNLVGTGKLLSIDIGFN